MVGRRRKCDSWEMLLLRFEKEERNIGDEEKSGAAFSCPGYKMRFL